MTSWNPISVAINNPWATQGGRLKKGEQEGESNLRFEKGFCFFFFCGNWKRCKQVSNQRFLSSLSLFTKMVLYLSIKSRGAYNNGDGYDMQLQKLMRRE